MAITNDIFRTALGHFASGVTVVTTTSSDGRPYGLTVSAFSSLSLTPPLVLVCIDNRAPGISFVKASGYFVVNVLTHEQEHMSRRFSSRQEAKFEGVGYKPGELGAPVLEGVLAFLECKVAEAFEGGDHTIFVGEVIAAHVDDGEPLLYFRGGYAGLCRH